MALARLALVVLALGAAPLARPPDHIGYVVRYGPGAPGKLDVMSRVAAHRGISWQPHMAAYTYARDADMGQVQLHIKGPAGEATFLVVDLPQPGRDRQALERRGVVAELDYASGALVCGKRWTGRARDCRVRVWIVRSSVYGAVDLPEMPKGMGRVGRVMQLLPANHDRFDRDVSYRMSMPYEGEKHGSRYLSCP